MVGDLMDRWPHSPEPFDAQNWNKQNFNIWIVWFRKQLTLHIKHIGA